MKRRNAIVVKKMILKDNDCGVRKSNKAKEYKLLDKMAHMSPKTYKKLNLLAKSLRDDSIKQYMVSNFQFTNEDYRKVKKLTLELSSKLIRNCKSGKLKLDVDPQRFLNGAPPAACNL